jgi:molybdate transport system ATP-binding protein
VLARDVSVARQRPQETSVINLLPVRLESLTADRGTALLQLVVGHPQATDWPLRADPPAQDDELDAHGAHGARGSPGLSPGAGSAPVRLLARVTRRSADNLNLRPGDALFAQIKGVALM